MDNNWLLLFHDNHDLDPALRQELFRKLWESWWPRLWVYLGGFSGLATEDAEELASDALLRAMDKAMDKAGSYEPSRPFAPWLYTLTRHLATGRVRQLRRRTELVANPALLGWHTDLPVPEESLLLNEERARVACAVATLPERERELAFLIYGAGLGLGEAAYITGEPLGTVKWRVHRLKAALRLKMEDKDAW